MGTVKTDLEDKWDIIQYYKKHLYFEEPIEIIVNEDQVCSNIRIKLEQKQEKKEAEIHSIDVMHVFTILFYHLYESLQRDTPINVHVVKVSLPISATEQHELFMRTAIKCAFQHANPPEPQNNNSMEIKDMK